MSARYRVVLKEPVPEKSTQPLRIGPIRDETGQVIPAGSLGTLVATLYRQSDEALINAARPAAQSIKNENGGSADAEDSWKFIFSPNDLTVLDQKEVEEVHVLLIGYTWSMAGVGYFEIVHTVRNLAYVA